MVCFEGADTADGDLSSQRQPRFNFTLWLGTKSTRNELTWLEFQSETWVTAESDWLLRWAKARTVFARFDECERILKLSPNYPLVHYHLGQAYERKGENDGARGV